VPDPGQHFTRVMPQVSKTDGVRVRYHEAKVSQNCGHNRWRPDRAGDSGLAETISWFR
jgi:hypothetical protein